VWIINRDSKNPEIYPTFRTEALSLVHFYR